MGNRNCNIINVIINKGYKADRKLISILILALAVFAVLNFNVISQISGLFTVMNLNLDIAAVPNAYIILDYPYVVTAYDSMNITAVFKNIGSTNAFIKMELYILDVNFSVQEVFYDGYASLLPSEDRFFGVTYIPNQTGFYVIHVNTTYSQGNVADAWGVFYVNPYYTPPSAAPEEEGAPYTPSPEEGEIGTPDISLEYDNAVEVRKGQYYVSYIKVKNTGVGNASLYDVMLYAKSMGIPFTITPQQIAKISSSEYGIFLISLNVPVNIETGEYLLNFNVTSREISKTGQIRITVKELDIMSEVYSTITNYLFIIQRFKIDVQRALEAGKDVTSVYDYLNKAESELNDAKTFYEKGDYYMAKERLDIVKKYLEMIVVELARITLPGIMIMLPAYITILLVVVIILCVVPVIFIIFTRKRAAKKSAKEAEETA